MVLTQPVPDWGVMPDDDLFPIIIEHINNVLNSIGHTLGSLVMYEIRRSELQSPSCATLHLRATHRVGNNNMRYTKPNGTRARNWFVRYVIEDDVSAVIMALTNIRGCCEQPLTLKFIAVGEHIVLHLSSGAFGLR